MMENNKEPFNILEALEDCKIPLFEFKRVLAFILILTDDNEFGSLHPAYVLEKYIRYIKCPVVPNEYLWGMHPALKNRFDFYCRKYHLGLDSEEDNDER